MQATPSTETLEPRLSRVTTIQWKGTHAEGVIGAVDLQAEAKNLVDRQVVVVAMDVVYDYYNLMAAHNKKS